MLRRLKLNKVTQQSFKPGSQEPLHGVTLKMMLVYLHEKVGWRELGQQINIKCFTNDPGINSSLKFLRKTPWARDKVEVLYLSTRQSDSSI